MQAIFITRDGAIRSLEISEAPERINFGLTKKLTLEPKDDRPLSFDVRTYELEIPRGKTAVYREVE